MLLDITMPGMNGLQAAERILRDLPGIRVLILSMHASDEYVTQALKLGVSGYLLKDAATLELQAALEAVAGGTTYLSPRITSQLLQSQGLRQPDLPAQAALTPRQVEVLKRLALGRSIKEIAFELQPAESKPTAPRSWNGWGCATRQSGAHAIRHNLIDADLSSASEFPDAAWGNDAALDTADVLQEPTKRRQCESWLMIRLRFSIGESARAARPLRRNEAMNSPKPNCASVTVRHPRTTPNCPARPQAASARLRKVDTPEAARGAGGGARHRHIRLQHAGVQRPQALEITRHDADLPFIIVSGNIGEDVAVGAMRAGAQDYLLKNNLTRPRRESEAAGATARKL